MFIVSYAVNLIRNLFYQIQIIVVLLHCTTICIYPKKHCSWFTIKCKEKATEYHRVVGGMPNASVTEPHFRWNAGPTNVQSEGEIKWIYEITRIFHNYPNISPQCTCQASFHPATDFIPTIFRFLCYNSFKCSPMNILYFEGINQTEYFRIERMYIIM